MKAARDTTKGASTAPIRRAGTRDRRPLLGVGLVFTAALAGLVLPAGASATAGPGGRFMPHVGAATIVHVTAAPKPTSAPASRVRFVRYGKAAFIRTTGARTRHSAPATASGAGNSTAAQASVVVRHIGRGVQSSAASGTRIAYGLSVLLMVVGAVLLAVLYPTIRTRPRRTVVPLPRGADLGGEHRTAA